MASFGRPWLPLGSGPFAAKSKQQQSRQRRLRSSSDAAAGGSAPQQSLLNNPVLKSGLISGSLSLCGDVLAQLLTNRGKQNASYDVARAARMGSFGLFFYGPYQHYWYRFLDRMFPARTVANFAIKVTANQLALAPLVITVVFAWNLTLQRKLEQFPAKVQADFVPTLLNGWKFWVPAATINFTAIPLQHQVLYMSMCGVLWTGYLSYSSDKK